MSSQLWKPRFTGTLVIVPAILLSACETKGPQVAVADAPMCRVAQEPTLLPTDLPESSGVAVSRTHPDVIWTHNDSGSQPELFALTGRGELIAAVHPAGGEMEDWEDLALAACGAGDCLYIGDIGDNNAERSEITVYRILEPAPGQDSAAVSQAFTMRYPDGPQDSEGLFVLPGEQLHIVTKGGHGSIGIYRYPGSLADARGTAEALEMELVRSLSNGVVPISDRVTGAAASADGKWVALRTYTTAMLYSADELLGSGPAPSPATIDLRMLSEAQGEAVAFGPEGSLVLTSEGGAQELPGMLSILWCEALAAPSQAPTPAD